MIAVDETHSADLRSWVDSANDPGGDFPIQNLPLGIVVDGDGTRRAGVAIGDRVLALDAAVAHGMLSGEARAAAEACAGGTLNALMARGAGSRRALRAGLVEVLRHDTDAGRRAKALEGALLLPATELEPTLPAEIGDYTDFYASIQHATNIGSMFRPDNPLLPNYKWVPIGYHGRSSSIVPSGTAIRRPRGQQSSGSAPPRYAPTAELDYECEVGAWVGKPNPLGEPVPIGQAPEHLFGLCLLNDWSARDVQRWEYQPLGPFLSKNFATTISPWVVTLEALEPFRVPAAARPAGDPAPLPYLSDPDDQQRGGFAITLEVLLSTERMRAQGLPPLRVSRAEFAELYWTLAQLVAHHTGGGCNLRPGDLLASGTVSGPARENRGCLLELTGRGREPLTLPTGETRTFLEDGDEVSLRGRATRAGFASIGFGECVGAILPAREDGA